MHPDVPTFEYHVAPMPPSRLGRRWGWELWRGERLVAAGWHLGERRALLALRTAASRAAHEDAGIRPLRAHQTSVHPPLLPGASVRVTGLAAACLLVPRPAEPGEARAA